MVNNERKPVCIVGAGPGGVAAALRLSSLGIPSILIDKHPEPFNKVCGDGLSGHALSALNTIDPEIVNELINSSSALPSWGVKFVSPDNHELNLTFNEHHHDDAKPSGILMKRIDFMKVLMKRVESDPLVTYMPGTKIVSAEFKDDIAELRAEKGLTIRTPLLIIATGTGSLLARQVQADPIIDYPGVGVRTYFRNVGGSTPDHLIEMHFYKELLPWYLWIFPLPGNLFNVGLALLHKDVRAHPESLKELLFKVLEEKPVLKERFLKAEQVGKVEAARLSYFTHWKNLAGNRFMVVGDAAGLVDPFTGEGIGNALMSGVMAADQIKNRYDKDDFSKESLMDYQEEIRRRLGPELELGLRIQKLAKNPILLNLVINRAINKHFVKNRLRDMIFNVNTKGKLTTPIFYLKLLLNIGR